MQNLQNKIHSTPLLPIVATVLLAFTQFLTPFFAELTHIGLRIEETANSLPGTSPETPAGYAFAIWFVIFTLSLIYAVVQALPSHRQNPVFNQIRPTLAVIFLLNTVWMLIAQIYGDVWQLALLITMMTILSIRVFLQVLSENMVRHIDKASFLLMPLLGLLSGWLSLAVFLNVGAVLKPYFMQTLALTYTDYALSLLIVTLGLVGWMLFRTKGNLWYGGTILWGLIAVIIANTEVPNTTVLWTASILSALVALALGIFKLRFKSQTA
ncbi:MAG: hypothetical protein K2X01_03365 [Cyanobacteria bacterium]|nr:hypothetical protein [Cyanobacteriota bacterium]